MIVQDKTGYREISALLKKELADQCLESGRQVISARKLAKRYNVSLLTANKAINNLVEDGILYRKQGSGTFVRENSAANYRIAYCGHKQFILGAPMDRAMQTISEDLILDELQKQRHTVKTVQVNDDTGGTVNPVELEDADIVTTMNGYITDELQKILRASGKPVVVYGVSYAGPWPFHQVVSTLSSCMDEVFGRLPAPEKLDLVILTTKYCDTMQRAVEFFKEARLRGVPTAKIRFVPLVLPNGDSGRLCGYQTGIELGRDLVGKTVFVTSDFISTGLVESLQKQGIRPGSDLQLISFDDLESHGFAAFEEPMLTSIGYSHRETCRAMNELFALAMQHPEDRSCRLIKIPTYLKIRKTGLNGQ